MSTGANTDQCSKCKTSITPQQATQTTKLFGDLFCANCIPDRKECSNCKAVVNEKQAAFTKTAYGKIYCPDPKCQEVAEKEAQAAINAPEPPELVVLRDQGWNFDKKNGAFTKEIDGKSVLIIYSDIKKRGGACLVGGKPYMPGDNATIDRELRGLFDQIDEAKGIKPKAEIFRCEPSNGNTPAIVAPVNLVLSVDSILKYIAPDATEEEAFMFLQLCIARKLNPFLKEAYLIKYSKTSAAAFVVGKDAFTKRADAHPEYQGLRSGIIVKTESGVLERRKGGLMIEKETLLGGWAEILRKGREPYYSEVALSEYEQYKLNRETNKMELTKFWKEKPATMIIKVAVVQGLRGQFPQEFAGLYDRAEIPEE